MPWLDAFPLDLTPPTPLGTDPAFASRCRREAGQTPMSVPGRMMVTTILGNRPQFVKAAAVSRALRQRCDEVLVHTGQHYDDDMSRIFFEELEIPRPERYLGIGGGSSTEQTARMLSVLEQELTAARPDLVLVYGDTNSTLAGAVVAAQLRIPVAHVEAGMRSFDRTMPEEINRIVTDHLSEVLLCSTPVAVENLRREGVAEGVHLVGDVMADVVLATRGVAARRSDALDRLGVAAGEYYLVTSHRQANVDDPARLRKLVDLLCGLPKLVIFPLHPRTRHRLESADLLRTLESASHMRLSPPVGYLDLVQLAAHADTIITDSGGLQKEAYVLGVRCVTLRDTTEWVETVESGWNVLVDLNTQAALDAVSRPLPSVHPDLYGDGRAGEAIADLLVASAAAARGTAAA